MPLPLTYNWRNLFVRKLSTSLTFGVIAVVVLVLAVLLSFSAGIQASLSASGSPQNLVVLKPGATAESTSILRNEEVARVVQTPGAATNSSGSPMISNELTVQTSIPRLDSAGTLANVAVRGVDDIAFEVHPEVRITEGRAFQQGAMEVIVGEAARERYANLQPGGTLPLGRLSNRIFTVVGVFEAGGGALESEIWAGRTVIADSFDRRLVSSVFLRLSDPSLASAAIDYIRGPAVQLEAKQETDYYKDLAAKTREIVVLTTVLVGIMAIGSVFAVANTMYASVDARRREIAMLRTIGFTRRSILSAFVIESLMIAVSACAVGLGLSLFLNGARQDFLSDTTWTVLAYELRITPQILLSALILACVVGVFGALAPAMRASRIHIIEALRKA